MVEDSIRTFALAGASIAAEIVTRFYIDHVPDNAERPFVQMQQVDDDQLYNHDGESGHIPFYQLNVYAETKAKCAEIAGLIFNRFAGHSGTMGDVTVGYTFISIVKSEFSPDSRNFKKILELKVGTNDR